VAYAPTNDADHAVKEEFYQRLAHILEKRKEREFTILMATLGLKK
jgi:hypothetical protein